jgi:FkbM family methyltransferase
MQNLIFSLINRFLVPHLGKVEKYEAFRRLYELSIKGMNIGGGSDVANSGELAVLQMLKAKLAEQQKIVIFDVGANIGDYAIGITKIFDKDKIELHCFEPSPTTYARLVDNIRSLGATGIHLHNFGLSNEATEIELYQDEELSGMTSVYKRRMDHFGKTFNKSELARFSTLDQFCAEQNISHIDFLKLDVEGHELKVLEGSKQMLNKVKYIQFEFGGCNIDSRTFFQDFYYLLHDQFDIYLVLKDGIKKLDGYKETYELFITTNFFCINKQV